MVAPSEDLVFESAFTLEAWIFPEELRNDFPRIMDFRRSGSRIALAIERANPRLSCAIGSNDLKGTQAIDLGVWTHVVFSYDGSAMRLYVNGELDAEGELSVSPRISGADLFIGDQVASSDRSYVGMLDELRVWNRARSHDEIKEWYDRAVPLDSDGLVALWDCNAGAGEVLIDRVGENDGSLIRANWAPSEAPLEQGETGKPGDCNGDGATNVSDAVCLLNLLFIGDGPESPCEWTSATVE
ncbi:MAG: LamG domain-containing protein, partial [Planctomycetota bacterium]